MADDLATALFEPIASAPPHLLRANSSSSSSSSSSSPPSSAVYTSSNGSSATPSKTDLSSQDPSKSLSEATSPSLLVAALDSLGVINESSFTSPPPPVSEPPFRPLPSTSSRPRLPHHSLSSLSVYTSRPARSISTPIPPSLQGTNLINNKNSPFHYQSVEGRRWQETDGGGEERSGVMQTGRRSDWADDVLGIM